MFKPVFNSRSIASLLAAFAIFGATHANAVQRTHVSAAFGNDANTATNCTAAAPCRFFQAAMTVTDNNGEVVVLDSGGYGAVTITQSVALIAPTGVYAGISVFPGANGVTIATAGVNVVLRGLTINGQGGNNGISMTAGSKLTVENCFIANLVRGININGSVVVRVADTFVRDNSADGIWLFGGVKATLSRVIVSNNLNYGLYAFGNSATAQPTVDIADSTFNGNSFGIVGESTSTTDVVKVSVQQSRINKNDYGIYAAGPVKISTTNNAVTNNNFGMFANGTGKILASGNTVSDNTNVGFYMLGNGVIESAGNNVVRNNGTNVFGTVTTVPTL